MISVVLLFVNSWIAITLRFRMKKTSGEREHKGCLPVNQANMMLLGSSVLFIVTQLPLSLLNVYLYTQPKESLSASLLADLEPIGVFLYLTNYSIDFFVYAGISAEYRIWIVTLFRRLCLTKNLVNCHPGNTVPVILETATLAPQHMQMNTRL